VNGDAHPNDIKVRSVERPVEVTLEDTHSNQKVDEHKRIIQPVNECANKEREVENDCIPKEMFDKWTNVKRGHDRRRPIWRRPDQHPANVEKITADSCNERFNAEKDVVISGSSHRERQTHPRNAADRENHNEWHHIHEEAGHKHECTDLVVRSREFPENPSAKQDRTDHNARVDNNMRDQFLFTRVKRNEVNVRSNEEANVNQDLWLRKDSRPGVPEGNSETLNEEP
jgi:hypothetical protein